MLMHAVHRAFAGRFYQVARPAYFASATSSSQMAEPAAMEIAVVGAHLTGMPLNHQLTGLGATLVKASKTAPVYRMFALNTQPPKPALIRVPPGQVGPLDIEIWSMPLEKVG